MDTSLVAGLDQESNICVHERNGHGNRSTVRQDEVGVVAELLDEGKDVVPSSAVQAGAVVTKLIDDLSKG
jgi:hypothetical protein